MKWFRGKKRDDEPGSAAAGSAAAERTETDAVPRTGGAREVTPEQTEQPEQAGPEAAGDAEAPSPHIALRTGALTGATEAVDPFDGEQVDDDPMDDEPLSRADLVADSLAAWSSAIATLSDSPTLLFQLHSAADHLDITHAHPSGVAQLLAGRVTRLTSLVREPAAQGEAKEKARAIRERGERYADELGLMTCYLAIGEATWEPADGSEPPHVPVLLRPLALRVRGTVRDDVDLDLDHSVEINPVLLRALRDAGIVLNPHALIAATSGQYGFDFAPVLESFRALGEPLPGFRVSESLVIGNMVDAVGPLVDDLAADRPAWTQHPVIAALAGDEEARESLAASARTVVEHEADASELFSVAVDPDEQAALAAVRTGSHVEISSPPGTQTAGTIVDLASELASQGRSVLVVSQRRTHLASLVECSKDRDLDSLVLDLSPSPALQRTAAAALAHSLSNAGRFRPDGQEIDVEALRESQEVLAGHVDAMHRTQQPWNASAHDALEALAELTRRRPMPRTRVRLGREVAERMVGAERERYASLLVEAAESGALTMSASTTPWFGASVTSDTQADEAASLVRRLREDIGRLSGSASKIGPDLGLSEVTTLADAARRLRLLSDLDTTLRAVDADAFTTDPLELIAACSPKAWREEHGVRLGFRERRRLRSRAGSLILDGSAPAGTLTAVREVRERWLTVRTDDSLRTPRLPKEVGALRGTVESAQTLADELGVLLDGTEQGGKLASVPFDELIERLQRLRAGEGILPELPRRTTLLRTLEFEGLGELAEDLRDRHVSPEQAPAELDLAWWTSVLEMIAAGEPTIAQYGGAQLAAEVEEYRRLDSAYVALGSQRIRKIVDDELVATMKRQPSTSRDAIFELNRSATLSVRDLLAKYEDILLRARPIWLASPYLVPQILPPGVHFDVVVIADAGRLPTAAAVSAISRAAQVVLVGDPFEYGGGKLAIGADALEDDDDIPALPLVFAELGRLLPRIPLRRDSRPGTGRVRRFLQEHLYDGELQSVPSPFPTNDDRLVIVDSATGPMDPETEEVESTDAELQTVADLVIEHMQAHPERSLAVLALTHAHARKVMDRITREVSAKPGLRDVFDAARPEPFVVVPSDQASGLVRDDVIVSIGYGRTQHNRVIHSFGPLSTEVGRRALTSVLSRARANTTIVSALRAEDLDPVRLRTQGARDLRALLDYLESGADERDGGTVSSLDEPSGEPGRYLPGPPPAPLVDSDGRAAEEDEIAARTPRPRYPDTFLTTPLTGQHAAEEPAAKGGTASEAEPGEPAEVARPVGSGDGTAEPATDTGTALEAPISSASSDQLLADLADRLWRLGVIVYVDYGHSRDRLSLALGHVSVPDRLLVAVENDGPEYVSTSSQRERDRMRAERLEAAGWRVERVWSWALFTDPQGEAERIARAVYEAADLVSSTAPEHAHDAPVPPPMRQLPRPRFRIGRALSEYSQDDFDRVVEWICSDGRARTEDELAAEVRSEMGFTTRSVLLDVSVSSAIRRYQDRQ